MDSLPRELVIQIFHAMHPRNRWALVSTCRGFYQLLSPLLYNHVELYKSHENDKDPLPLFFSAVQRNIHLANDVRKLTLYGPRSDNIWIEDNDETCHGIWVGEELLTDQLLSSGSKQEIRDGELLDFSEWDTRAVVSLLIIRLKNLQSLTLGYAYWYDHLYLSRVFKMKGVMKNLKQIEFHTDPPETGVDSMGSTSNAKGWTLATDTEMLRYLLQLPSLESLCCPVWQDRTENDYWELLFAFKPLELPCSNLTCLFLPQSSLHHTTINRILTAAPNLREFEYFQLIEFDHNGENTPILCEELGAVLKPVKNTLRKLTLGVQCQKDANQERILPDIRGTVRSLPDFTQLTHLSIYHRFLIDTSLEDQTPIIELLPPTLRVLRILGTDPSSLFGIHTNEPIHYDILYNQLHEYIDKEITHTPHLQSLDVIIGVEVIRRPELDSAYTRLREACVSAGIVFHKSFFLGDSFL